MAEIGGLNLKFTSDTTGFAKGSEKVKQGLQSVDDKAKNSKGLSKWAEKAATAAKLLAGPAAIGGVALAFDKMSASVVSAGNNAADFFNEISMDARNVLLPTLEAITAEQMAQQAATANWNSGLSGAAIRWEKIKTAVSEVLGSTVNLEAAQRDAIDATIDHAAIYEKAYKNVVQSVGAESSFGLLDRTFSKALAKEQNRLKKAAVEAGVVAGNAQTKAYEEIQNASYDRQLLRFQRHQMDRSQFAIEQINIQIRETEAQQTLAFGENNKRRIGEVLAALTQQREIMLSETSETVSNVNAVWTNDYTGPGSAAWINNQRASSNALTRTMNEKEMERIEFANTLAEDEWAGYGSPQFNARMLREREGLQEALSEQEKLSSESRVSATATMFGNLATLTQAGSKKLFKIGKVAAISEALINAYKGISETWNAYPYPWNIPMAAAHAVSAFAQVRSIASTQYGSTSAGGGVVGGAGGNAAAAISTPAASINVVGSEGATFSRDQIIGLIGQLNEAVGDGAQLSATAA